MTGGRMRVLLAAAGGAALLAGPGLAPPAPRLIYNATPSAPVGLYAVRPTHDLPRGRAVLAALQPDAAHLAAARAYLPAGVPVLKRIAAGPGETVCRIGGRVTIDGRLAATALAHDRAGRPLPVWQGCHRLAAGEVFLLSGAHPAAFDGRYFGPTPAVLIVGEARVLWTR